VSTSEGRAGSGRGKGIRRDGLAESRASAGLVERLLDGRGPEEENELPLVGPRRRARREKEGRRRWVAGRGSKPPHAPQNEPSARAAL